MKYLSNADCAFDVDIPEHFVCRVTQTDYSSAEVLRQVRERERERERGEKSA